MKVIILAGGFGTRISEETQDKPKPMVLINGRPILEHIIEIYAQQGFTDFVIALGYKGEIINSWFSGEKEESKTRLLGLRRDFKYQVSPQTVNISTIETGLNSQTGARLKICMESFTDPTFMVTYGDGLGNINLRNVRKSFDISQKNLQVTAVHPPARFGYLKLVGNNVIEFGEKKPSDAGWINGGFFILNRETLKYFQGENESFETDVLPRLVENNDFAAFCHDGYWQPMDTLREKEILEEFAKCNPPPWLDFK